jgi:hypothetical protein
MEKQKSLKSWLSNYLSLSTVSSDGTPNRQTMFCQKNFWAVFDVIVDNALASIHLVKYSTATKVNLRFPWVVGNDRQYPAPSVEVAMCGQSALCIAKGCLNGERTSGRLRTTA